MSLSGRKLRSARASEVPPTNPRTNDQDQYEQDKSPKKEKQKRRQTRRQDTDQQAPTVSITVASGRNARTAGPGQDGQAAEEEEDEEAAEEDGSRPATTRSKRRRSHQLQLSPGNRKRTRRSHKVKTPASDTDSGEEPDISDLELDDDDASVGNDREDALLKSEAQHLIDEFEQGRQSDAESEDDADEGLVFEITNISQNGEDMLLTWSEAEGELYRAPLEGFLALADEPLEAGVISSLWYQDATEFEENYSPIDGSIGDYSGSALDIDEAADQLLFMQGLDSSDSDGSIFTDEGETTDSLDDGDELALIRFGIEVDEPQHALSMSPLQVGETTIDMDAFATNPKWVIQQTAHKLGVNLDTATKIVTGVGLSVMARNRKQGFSRRKCSTATGEPEMGEFMSSRAIQSTIVIEDKAPPAPSPFSTTRRQSRTRRESQGSPLTSRARRTSLLSSHSSHTLTPAESPHSVGKSTSPSSEPVQEELTERMELEDVLHDDVLKPVLEAASEFSESDGMQEEHTDIDSIALGAGPIQMDDLDRWDRVPIGAFRRSRGDRSPTSSVPHGRRRYVSTSGAAGKGSPALLPVKRPARGKLHNYKQSPKMLRSMTKRPPAAPSAAFKNKGRLPSTSLRKVNTFNSSPRTRSRATTPRAGFS